MVNMMESKNPMVRLSVYGKIKKIIESLQGRHLSETDRKVIRGLFVKYLKDFDEDFREKMKNVSLLDRLRGGGMDTEESWPPDASNLRNQAEELK